MSKSYRSENIRSMIESLPEMEKINIHQELLKKIKNRKTTQTAIDKIIVCKPVISTEFEDINMKTRKEFFKCSGYKDENVELGAGSYGSVFSVRKNHRNYAVKQIKIYDEFSLLDELKLSILFSKKKIGPTIKGFYRINTPDERRSSGFIFIIMEKLDYTLSDYIKANGFNSSDEKSLLLLLKKTVLLKVLCTDIKPENIMVKITDKSIEIKLIDFGEFCCDILEGYNEKISLDLLILLTAYTLKSHSKVTVFKKHISRMITDKKRFALIIKGLTEKTKKCSIIDLYSGNRSETFGSKNGRQLNHYAIKKFIKKYRLYKGVHYFDDKKPKYLDKYFGEKGNEKAIKSDRYKESELIYVWSARVIITAVFILNGYLKSYKEILPPDLWEKLVKRNKFLYSKNLRFYKKTKKNKKRGGRYLKTKRK